MKMTRKEIQNGYKKVYCVGYGELQYLLRRSNKVGYNSGVYGWNYDVFSLDNGNIAICTGYRGMPGIRIDYTIADKYEKKAEALFRDYSIKYEEQQKKLEKLVKKFIEEIQK